MARYGMDYGRDFGPRDRGGRNEGWGGYGGWQGPRGMGGARPDGWGSSWRDSPGEEGWFGEGYERYPGGFGAGQGGGYGGGGYGDRSGRWGYEPRSFGGPGGGYGAEFGRGGYPDTEHGGFGGYGVGQGGGGYGGGYAGGGYSGRELGYEGGSRGGRGRPEQRMRAAELMTENPACITPDTTLAEAARQMRDLDVGIMPVVESLDDRRLRGVITDRDIAVRAVAEGKDGEEKVADFMTEQVKTCNKNDGVQQVLEVMRMDQVRRVPITDRDGRLVGIIAQADLAVDYAGDDMEREMRVVDTIERISEPARPEGGRMAARGRGGSRSGRSDGENG